MKKLAVVMLFGLFAVGCGKGGAGDECSDSTGCSSGLKCVKVSKLSACGADAAACGQKCEASKSICVNTCTTDAECANTSSPAGSTPKCLSDCAGNHYCGAAT